MLMYCKKCGRTWRKDFDYESDDCDICGSTCYPVPDKYLLCFDGEIEKDLLDNEKEEQFMEECVKTSPEFDEELFNARDGILAKKQARWEEESRIGQAIMDGADPELAFRNGVEIFLNVLLVEVWKLEKFQGQNVGYPQVYSD